VPPPPPPGYAPPPPPPGGYTPPPGYTPPGYTPPPPGYQQPYGYQPGYGYPTPPRTEGNAVAALVCAIGSFVVCIPFLAIAAIPLASSAKKKIDASSGQLTGLGLVTASKWIAFVNLGLWVLIIGFMILTIGLGIATSPSNDFDSFERIVL
jgi:hypothetical protein